MLKLIYKSNWKFSQYQQFVLSNRLTVEMVWILNWRVFVALLEFETVQCPLAVIFQFKKGNVIKIFWYLLVKSGAIIIIMRRSGHSYVFFKIITKHIHTSNIHHINVINTPYTNTHHLHTSYIRNMCVLLLNASYMPSYITHHIYRDIYRRIWRYI